MAAERQHMFASSVTGVTAGNMAIYIVTFGPRKNSSPSAGTGGSSLVCHGKTIVLALKKEQSETGGLEGV